VLFGVTNSLAASQTNQSGTNLPPEIMAGLTNLQNNLISLLPQLAAFNNSFDFVSVNGTNRLSAGSGQSALPAPPSPGTNTGTTTNAASLIPLPATNAVVLSPRDTVRALLLLQDDLERTLPLLGALNGTNFPGFSQVPGLSTNTFASLTNNLQTLSTTIPTNRLTPTGR